MRSRNIKPGFFRNDELGEMDPLTRLVFIGLWCAADREGRIEYRPARLKADILPYDSRDINGDITVLSRSGFITMYEVDDCKFLQINNFKLHQNPHHTEAKSKLPDISDGCIVTVNSPLNTGKYPADSLIPDSLIPDSLIPDSLIPDSLIHPVKSSTEKITEDFPSLRKGVQGEGLNGKSFAVSDKPKQPQPDKLSDEQWIQSVKANPIYKGLDIDREYGKMVTWCEVNRKIPSRKRFINWINRAEKPITAVGTSVIPPGYASPGAMGGLERAAALRAKKEQAAEQQATEVPR